MDALVAACLTAGAVTTTAAPPDAPTGTAFELDESHHFGRMRLFAQPGDLGLRNEAVTAVIRREDGLVVDFFPNRPSSPTLPQLGDVGNVDGIWSWVQELLVDGVSAAVTAGEVTLEADAVVVRAGLSVASSDFQVVTRYHVARGHTRSLVAETRIEHLRGSDARVGLADVLKWGNVPVWADGRGEVDRHFEGEVAWVGRKGASGDLALEAAEGRAFHVDLHPAGGFSPAVRAVSGGATLPSGQGVTVRRALSYRSIAAPPTSGRPAGTLALTVRDEQGRPLPAKLTLSGTHGTRDPAFGTRGDVTGAGRFVWSGTGSFERTLPVGSYRVVATAGPERAAAELTVTIDSQKTATHAAVLERLVETPGWVSADLHLHQVPSVDADISFHDRIISVVAEGLELAVATDHYAITDLGPTVRAMVRRGELSRPLLTVPGSELSTTGHRFGHFNAFPLPLDADIPYHDVTPQELIAGARRATPEGVVQVNHPRWSGIGYFRLIEMDPKTGDVPETHAHLWEPGFDAIEVYNGVDVPNEAAVLGPFFDWLNLLARGHRYVATGSSDSHNLYYLDPGLPRTMIHWAASGSDDADLSAPIETVVDALKNGHATVTSGPFVDVSIGEAGPGDTVETNGGRVDVAVRVRAVPWVDVSRLRLFVGAGRTPAVDRAIPASARVVRMDDRFRVTVPDGSFVVALVTGARPLPNVHAPNARPLAFANPIWVRHSGRK